MWHYCVFMFIPVDAGGVSTTATAAITLKETNDFPPQLFPLSGSVCRDTGRMNSGLVVTAVDEDFPPHAAPFIFEMPDYLSVNWTVVQVNGKGKSIKGEDGGSGVDLHKGCYRHTILIFTLSPFFFLPQILMLCSSPL